MKVRYADIMRWSLASSELSPRGMNSERANRTAFHRIDAVRADGDLKFLDAACTPRRHTFAILSTLHGHSRL